LGKATLALFIRHRRVTPILFLRFSHSRMLLRMFFSSKSTMLIPYPLVQKCKPDTCFLPDTFQWISTASMDQHRAFTSQKADHNTMPYLGGIVRHMGGCDPEPNALLTNSFHVVGINHSVSFQNECEICRTDFFADTRENKYPMIFAISHQIYNKFDQSGIGNSSCLLRHGAFPSNYLYCSSRIGRTYPDPPTEVESLYQN